MKKFTKHYPALTFFAITIVWIWISMPALFAVMHVNSREDFAVQHVILVFLFNSPSVFGILLTLVIGGREGLKTLFARTARWRVKLVWYAAALLLPAAMYGLNRVGRHFGELEEAWLVQALVREDGLSQVEVAVLLGRHKSWVCRRLAMMEKLCAAAQEDLRLGLLSPTMARAIPRLL